MYETLPAEVKGFFTTAVEALRKQLQPPKRKQQSDEPVDKYAQDFEMLFDKSYGNREGIDQASKDMLKRDLFVQGLLWKWQEKVLPSSANTFGDALYQARIARGNYLTCTRGIMVPTRSSHHIGGLKPR